MTRPVAPFTVARTQVVHSANNGFGGEKLTLVGNDDGTNTAERLVWSSAPTSGAGSGAGGAGALARSTSGNRVWPESTVPQPASAISMPHAVKLMDARRMPPIYGIRR